MVGKYQIQTAKCPHCGRPLYVSSSERYVYQCHYCDEDFFESEARYDSVDDRDEAIEELWDLAEDEPFDPDREVFERNFYGIADEDDPYPITRFEYLKWFDKRHSKGAAFLLYGRCRDK